MKDMQAERTLPDKPAFARFKSFVIRSRFMFYSRPVFRANDLATTHLARVFMRKPALLLEPVQAGLKTLNVRKVKVQGELSEIGNSHGHVCASCGRCCKGVHERDSFSDRVMIDPSTRFTKGRRRESDGDSPAVEIRRTMVELPMISDGGTLDGACHQLTNRGCRLPHDMRPIQCAAYFCWAACRALSDEECLRGTRALKEILRFQWKMVGLAVKSRFVKS